MYTNTRKHHFKTLCVHNLNVVAFVTSNLTTESTAYHLIHSSLICFETKSKSWNSISFVFNKFGAWLVIMWPTVHYAAGHIVYVCINKFKYLHQRIFVHTWDINEKTYSTDREWSICQASKSIFEVVWPQSWSFHAVVLFTTCQLTSKSVNSKYHIQKFGNKGCAENRNSVFKKLNRPKIWHPFRRSSDRNCMQSAIQIKSDLTCIKCADERFKT